VVAAAAKRLIRGGHDVSLPQGYGADVLDRITWRTGAYGERVTISVRLADELAQIARTLHDDHGAEITFEERAASVALLGIVTSSRSR
jgi:hypothetical protein